MRQLRCQVDDSSPERQKGIHTYDRSKGLTRPRRPELAMAAGSGGLSWGSSVILGR